MNISYKRQNPACEIEAKDRGDVGNDHTESCEMKGRKGKRKRQERMWDRGRNRKGERLRTETHWT
jgi:hypothetical protein